MVALGGRLRGTPETGEKAPEASAPPPSSKTATGLQVREASAPEVVPGGRLRLYNTPKGAQIQLNAASMSASATVFNPPTATSRPIVGYVQNINRASVALSFLRIDPDGNTSSANGSARY